MSEDHLSITFKCPKCGGTVLELPDDYTDDSDATCKNCGVSFGRWGDIKSRAMESAKDHVRGAFKDAFKGLKGWKVK